MAKVKVQISIDEDLLGRIDSYADDNYVTRSGVISLATNQYLCTKDMMVAIRNISLAMSRIAESGEIDEESKKMLQEYQTVANFYAKAGV